MRSSRNLSHYAINSTPRANFAIAFSIETFLAPEVRFGDQIWLKTRSVAVFPSELILTQINSPQVVASYLESIELRSVAGRNADQVFRQARHPKCLFPASVLLFYSFERGVCFALSGQACFCFALKHLLNGDQHGVFDIPGKGQMKNTAGVDKLDRGHSKMSQESKRD